MAPSTGQPPSKPLDPSTTPNLDTEATPTAQLSSATNKSKAIDPSRTLESTDPEDLAELNKANAANGKEGNVGEVRRKVEEMTYEEGIDLDPEVKSAQAEAGKDDGVELELPEKEDKPDSAMSLETRLSDDQDKSVASKTDGVEGGVGSEPKDGEGLKRKALDRSQSSFVDDDAAPKKAKDEEEVSDFR